MFKFINDRFKALSLPVALVVLTLICFAFALIASTAAFYWFNGALPNNLVLVVAITSVVAATPLILQSMPTIKYLQNSRERLKITTDELEAHVAELDAAYRDLNTARAELEGRVEERTREVDEARREAETANRAKSDFLAKMSHELRTPLNAVIGFSELLSHRDALAPEKKLAIVEDYAGTIHRSGQHLLSLVNDLLDLSKIEAGQMKMHPETINLVPFIDDIRDIIAVPAHARWQTVELSTAGYAGVLIADRRATKQILINLLSNAVKYSPKDTSIKLSLTQRDDKVVFTIADEGYGMMAEEIEQALEPFSRLANAARAGADGTGLGLAIVASLVEAQGGTLGIQSAVDKGTTVTVTLPLGIALSDDAKSAAVA